MLRLARLGALLMVVLTAACAEPPNKEMNQAQGAIDAARAAGADRYAADELNAAVEALKRSDEAVQAGDYRQALSHAIDSRERAQNAAKMAVDGRAAARGQVERAVAEVETLLTRAEALLGTPDVTRLPRRTLRPIRDTSAAAHEALQEARSAIDENDYDKASKALGTIAQDLQAALAQLDAALAPRASKRPR